MSTFNKFIALGITLLVLLLAWLLCLNHVGAGECGVAYNSWSGTVSTQGPGWHVTGPLTRVACLPTTPFWVTIPTSATIRPRHLVRFNPEHAAAFVSVQGFSYYDGWLSRHVVSDSPVAYLFVGYAFSDRPHAFLTVLE